MNNVLGFPYIFRGALDVRATPYNEEMKLAAVKALAALAKETVPDMVNMAYNEKNIDFGQNYIIPKPLDPRLLLPLHQQLPKQPWKVAWQDNLFQVGKHMLRISINASD